MYDTPFEFKELDLTLSLRDYFLTTEFRDSNGDGLLESLPYIYPTMQEDEDQFGVRLGNLAPEQEIPCYPCIGLIKSGLFEKRAGFGGWHVLTYGYFLDAAIKAKNSRDHFDRDRTIIQAESLSNDLRILLTESKFAHNIPFYVYTEEGDIIERRGTIKVVQNPAPNIVTNGAASPVSSLRINVALQIEVVLVNEL